MARVFNGSTANNLTAPGAVGSPFPYTMAVWATRTTGGVVRALMSLNDGSTANMLSLTVTAADLLQVQTNGGGSIATVNTSAAVPIDGSWFHACGVFGAVNSRAVYLNGGNVGTQTNTRSPTGMNNFTVGRRLTNSWVGALAWATVWNAELTAEEVLMLAKGANPRKVRPSSIVSLWPITGRHSPEIDLVGGSPLTVNGTLTQSDHPRTRPR